MTTHEEDNVPEFTVTELRNELSNMSITLKQEMVNFLLNSMNMDEKENKVILNLGIAKTGETKTITIEEGDNIEIDLCVFNCISRSSSEDLSPELGILELLGEGGFGAAYKFTPSDTTNSTNITTLVIKGFFESDNDNPKSSCQRELNHIRKFCHPNVIKYYGEHIHDDGNIYNVMEYGGQSLEKRYLKISKMPEEQIKLAIFAVASGLDYLHSGPKYIVHRDIRSDNITVTEDGVYKIIDFGISSRTTVENSRFESNTDWGNPFWKSPEYCRYMKALWKRECNPGCMPAPGRKSDIWSFGVFGLEMISFPKRPGYFKEWRYENRYFGSDAYITDLVDGQIVLTDYINTQDSLLADVLKKCFATNENARVDSKKLKEICETLGKF